MQLGEAEPQHVRAGCARSADVVSHVPRLEQVTDILESPTAPDIGGSKAAPLEVGILRSVAADAAIERGVSMPAAAIAAVRILQPAQDARVINAPDTALDDKPAASTVLDVPIWRTVVGKKVPENVYSRTGVPLIARRPVGGDNLVARLRSVAESGHSTPTPRLAALTAPWRWGGSSSR